MLKIKSEKIWKLIKKDRMIQEELERYLEEEIKSLEKEKEILTEEVKKLQTLNEKVQANQKRIQELEDLEINLNNQLSKIEFQKIFAERRIKKLRKQIARCFLRRSRKKRLERLLCQELEEYQGYVDEQENIRSQISQTVQEKEKVYDKKRDLQKERKKQEY